MKRNFILTAIATVAVVVAAGICSAFTSVPQKAQLQEQWFEYNGSGDRTQSENYSLLEGTPSSCGGEDEVCAIRAMDNGFEQPDINSALVVEINAAIGNKTESQNVHLQD